MQSLFFHPISQQQVIVEAGLVGLGNSSGIFAQSLDINAQTAETAFNTPIWHTLVNGSRECENCSSVGLSPSPRGAKRIKVDVVLPPNIKVALLWLASMSYTID